MLRNYFKVALRHMLRNKTYSLINILGLAVGIACCLIIMVYVRDELSFDKFHKKGEQIYRMALDRKYPGRMRSYAIIPHSYAEAVKSEFPEVEESVRLLFFQGNNLVLRVGEQTYEEPHAIWADSTFFDVFSIPLLRGEPATALAKPNTVVITEATAEKYFGKDDPLGKVLDIPNTENDLVVSGVCANVPGNSHLVFDLMMSSTSLNLLKQSNYVSFAAYTYLLLKEGTDYKALEAKFPDLVRKYAAGQIQRQFSASYDDYVAAGNGYHYYLQPINDIYLHSNLEGEFKPPGSMTRIYIFTIIALFILIIAIINFMNLSTARSTERAKEVGIRKTLGSLRQQIAGQFLVEAVFISILSMVIAGFVLAYLLPVFNELSGKAFTLDNVLQWRYVPWFILFALVVGLLSGSYPAAVLSGFKPVEVLKGKLISTGHGIRLRNGLVIFQFAISVVLIISTIVVYNQLQFIRNKELGFNKNQVISLQGAGALQTQTEAFKEELLKLPEVISIGGCNTLPGDQFFGTSFRKEGENETMFGSGIVVDDDFIGCMQMEVMAGRSFSEKFNDSLSLLLNETAVRELQLKEPLTKRVSTINTTQEGEDVTTFYTIIGVVKDFHFQSLHQVISPVYFFHNDANQGVSNLITARIQAGDFQSTIKKVENLWIRFLPDQPFRFSFLDADLEELYLAEQVSQKVFGLFSLLAIFIACMGLLGLAAYMTQQRTKEIGIRKVLGASVSNIVELLSKDFLKLVIIALLVATPLAWYAMNKWLQDFAYSINLSWWMFALAGVLAIAIAFLTVSYQSVRAAFSSPVKALRDE